ncbi:MAG: ribonucleoside-diphosphate reductase subunit alpha [Candidatus Lightella neohaematopini]|nr:ribonucleoside-diphosphate reductase subunit alpha [Candidatus Lightella neohaematopini]
MNYIMLVIKRNGDKERINFNKIKRVIHRASIGLNNISIKKIEHYSYTQLYNGIKTIDIHEILTKVTADLISYKYPNYQYLAARLVMFNLRKRAYGKFNPPKLYDHVINLINLGKYDKKIIDYYDINEFEHMNNFIDHYRDMNFSYVAIKQLENKYLVQNRVTGKIYESAQFLYILIAACLFSNYNKKNRLDYIKKFYDAISTFKISLPTPIMSGVRTPTKQFSSCVLIECNDSINSINATSSIIMKYISQRAGIGINAGRIRAVGSPIRGGETFHTGCIPFYKHFQTAVKSCSQGGVRGGAATIFYPIWHLEIENLLVLKNNRGIETNRVRHIDYGVQLNKLMYQRLIDDKYITLFSPSDVPDLYDAFFSDQKKFKYLYEKYEKNKKIRHGYIKARELFSLMMKERTSTGRIYIQHVDHCNTHSSFNPKIAPIKQSNLCLEIVLPTKPLEDIYDNNGEVALCTLSAFNLGEIQDLNDFSELAALIVRALDELIDYQHYLIPAAKISTINRRSLGIGVINFAYYLAKNGVRYSDGSANKLTHRTFEAMQYFLLKASCDLAKEKGMCSWFNETNYYNGILPIDTYKKDVDNIVNEPLYYNWEELRKNIKRYGLRNSSLSAIMPSETSSQISNATNGIEPPRGFVTIKASKDGILKQVIPEAIKLRNFYELLWNLPNNYGYLKLVSIMQKFIDQSISTNTNYDPSKFLSGKIPMQQLIKDLLISYKLGIKTLYYQNTRDNNINILNQTLTNNNDCDSGACKI